MEVLGNSAVTALQPAIQELFTSLVMPSFKSHASPCFSKSTNHFPEEQKNIFKLWKVILTSISDSRIRGEI
jgi:hypothetical protein